MKIPPPQVCQLTETKDRRGRRVYKLPDGRVVAYYWKTERALVKTITARHVYGNKPGIAFNAELLALADNWPTRPKKLVANRTDHRPGPDGDASDQRYGTYRVSWEVARAYAYAALALGDSRWLIEDDVDTQILIPWAAWNGLADGPSEPERQPQEAAQASLFKA